MLRTISLLAILLISVYQAAYAAPGESRPAQNGWQRYTSPEGRFRLNYPPEAQLHLNEIPSVDGIWVPMTDTVTIVSQSANFTLSIHYQPADPEMPVDSFVDFASQCVDITASPGQPRSLAGVSALFFPDVVCGPTPVSELYTVHSGLGYRLVIRHSSRYENIREQVEAILDTFTFWSPVADTASAEADKTLAEVALDLSYQLGGQVKTVALDPDRSLAYLGQGPRLVVLDVADPGRPTPVGQSEPLQGLIQELVIGHNRAYVAAGEAGLYLLDLASPFTPRLLGVFKTGNLVLGLVVLNDRAHLIEEGGLRLVDITNPVTPQELGFVPLPSSPETLAVTANYAYIGHAGGLAIVDLSNPSEPQLVNSLDLPGVSDITVAGPYAYLAGDRLRVLDLSDPAYPVEVGDSGWGPSLAAVTVTGSYAYLIEGFCEFGYCGGNVQVIDVSDSTQPQPASRWPVADFPEEITIQNGVAYLATHTGLTTFGVGTSGELEPLGEFLGIGDVSDVVGAVDAQERYVYLTGDRNGSLHILETTPSDRPQLLSRLPDQVWIDGLAVGGGYAYLPAWHDGLRIFDVSDPTQPQQASELSSAELPGAPLQVALAGGWAYLAMQDGRLRTIDVSDPARPRSGAELVLAEEVLAVAVAGNKAYVSTVLAADAGGQPALQVVDISDPAHPSVAGLLELPIRAHQVMAKNDLVYLAVADCYYWRCTGGLIIVDVSDPALPRRLGVMGVAGGSLDVAVQDDYAYLAAGNSGLALVDISDPAGPRLITQLDTPGRAQAVAVTGGDIYVADGDGGLLIVRLTSETE